MSENNPLVSVILPLYNAQNFILEAVNSVLNQTYKKIELIVINDGSTDNSLEVVSSIKDSRLTIINQTNIGLAATLNKALKIANGQLIARMDADDICIVNRIELQVKCFLNNPNLVLLGTATNYIDEKNNFIARAYPIVGNKNIKYFLLNKGNVMAHPTVMFKKDAVLKAGGYCEKIGQYFEDHDLWVSMINMGEFDNLAMPLLNYRLTPGSISAISLENDNFNEEVLKFINQKINGNAPNFTILTNRKQKLSAISIAEKTRLFNSGIKKLITKENKMKQILNLLFLIPLKQKLQLLSFIRTKI